MYGGQKRHTPSQSGTLGKKARKKPSHRGVVFLTNILPAGRGGAGGGGARAALGEQLQYCRSALPRAAPAGSPQPLTHGLCVRLHTMKNLYYNNSTWVTR